MKIAFLGLGSMGRPMAANLVRAGHAVTLWNRTLERARNLADEVGGEVAGTPADAAADAELAITMLSDDDAVEAVALGEEGLSSALPGDAVHASMSTISPRLSRRLARIHAARGQGYVAAPVFGRPDMAKGGQLFVLAAGRAEAVEVVREPFGVVGQAVIELGEEVEKANVVKLAGNLLLAAAIEAMGETFALVAKYGVEPGEFLEIANGLFRSPIYEAYGGLIVEGRFEGGGFALEHGLKDVRYGLAAADDAAVPMPVAGAVRDRLLTAMARGWGERDWAALGKVAAEAAGLDGDA